LSPAVWHLWCHTLFPVTFGGLSDPLSNIGDLERERPSKIHLQGAKWNLREGGDGVRYIRMITNQSRWSGHFGLVVTSTGYGAVGPGSVPALGMCSVTLSFLLHTSVDGGLATCD
jgi:hypothetical protein